MPRDDDDDDDDSGVSRKMMEWVNREDGGANASATGDSDSPRSDMISVISTGEVGARMPM